MKQRFNQGLVSNLYFWRNNTSEEVDLVLEEDSRLQPVEIKSSQTFNAAFLDGLAKWARYAGDDSMVRNGVAVQSWRSIFTPATAAPAQPAHTPQ